MRTFLVIIVFISVIFSAYSQSLDDAIRNAALQIQEGLESRSTIIVYQFQSANNNLSNYILNELFDLLVNSRKFIVLDRDAQEVVNAEIEYQFNTSAGMISDDSLASLTRRIGAQAIITGSLDDAGDEYRFRIRVIGTETVAAVVSFVGRVSKNDRRIANLAGREASIGEKIATGALNIIFGLGSYLEHDIGGGITISAGYLLAAGLFIVEATALDWSNPLVGVPATIGLGVAGITFIYGFIRPFIYNRSPKLASIFDNTQFGIYHAGDPQNGGLRFQITHIISF